MLANPQSRLLSPSFLLILLFGEVIGLKIEIWLHLVIGLLGTFLLARFYGLDRAGAMIAAFIFMLNSMYALNLTVGMTWFMTVAYIPWAFLFFLKAMEHWPYALASGLCLVLIFFGGGAYTLPIVLLFLGFYGLILIAFKECNLLRVGGILLIMIIFMLALGAIKFFPSIQFLQEHPRHIYDYSGFSLNTLRFSLFSRDQTLEAITHLPIAEAGFITGVTGGMDENGMYIGLIPFALFVVGIGLHDKRRLFLLLCFVIFLWISFGNRLPRLELWSWLHLLPVYNAMRVAQRFRIIFILCLAIFAGFGLQTVKQWLHRTFPYSNVASFVAPALVALVFADLLAVSLPVFKDAFTIPPLVISRSEQFYQVWEWPVYDEEGWIEASSSQETNPFAAYNPFGIHSTYSSLYPTFLSNVGTINGYETANVPRNAVPESAENYRGEVYLEGTAGTVTISRWSPNRITLAVNASGPGLAVLNQNYYSGWWIEGRPAQPLENWNGLLAVRVSPGEAQVELYYRPTSFVVGLIVTSLTVLLTLILMVFRPR